MPLSGDLYADGYPLPADARGAGPGVGELGPSLRQLLQKLTSLGFWLRCFPQLRDPAWVTASLSLVLYLENEGIDACLFQQDGCGDCNVERGNTCKIP